MESINQLTTTTTKSLYSCAVASKCALIVDLAVAVAALIDAAHARIVDTRRRHISLSHLMRVEADYARLFDADAFGLLVDNAKLVGRAVGLDAWIFNVLHLFDGLLCVVAADEARLNEHAHYEQYRYIPKHFPIFF